MPKAPVPFFAGGPIPATQTGQYMHGYEEERRTAAQILGRRSPTRFGVFGPRRSGKTSFLLSLPAAENHERVHIDCHKIWPLTPAAFYRLLLDAQGLPRPETLPEGAPAKVYPQLPVPKKGGRVVLVLDNADALDAVDPELLDEYALYAVRLPQHSVLTGEERRLRPLVDHFVQLAPFSEATAADFLTRRFRTAGMSVDPGAHPIFYEFTRGIPDSLQRLALSVWRRARDAGSSTVAAEDVDAAAGELVDELPTQALEGWAAARGYMRDAFIAMCLFDLTSPTEIARRVGLEPKNVIVLLRRLDTAHDLVERTQRGTYRVRDPLLKHYVRKEFGSAILR